MRKLITLLSCVLLSCMAIAQGKKATPITIGETRQFHSAILGEQRMINIYLPEGYNADDTTRYAVIYLLDGGLDEDFLHIAGLVQFNTFPWVNRLRKSIVVGIANTDRKRDMTFTTTMKADRQLLPTGGGSSNFILFIAEELQPYIQRHYRVNDNKTLIGESLAGLLATEIVLKKPRLFDTYIIVSPSLWWDNGSVLKQQQAIHADDISIYLAVGKEGLTPGANPRVMEVDANLLAEKLREDKHVKLFFDYLPDENHATIMHQAVLNAFKKLR